MKFDRDTLLGIIICAVILFGWEPIGRALGWLPKPETVKAAAAPTVRPSASPAPESKSADAVPAPPVVKPAISAPKAKPAAAQKPLEISNRDMALSVDKLTGGITSITLKNYRNAERTARLSIDVSRGGQGALELSSSGASWVTTATSGVSSADGTAVLTREMVSDGNGHFTVIQTWNIGNSGYCTHYTVSVTNRGKQSLALPGLLVNGGNLGTWQMVSGDKVRLPSHSLDYLTVNGELVDTKADKKDSVFFSGGSPMVRWAAVSNKYFCLILKGADSPYSLNRGRFYFGSGKNAAPCISVNASLPGIVLAPEESKTFSFDLYSGPKILRLLDEFDPSTGKVMHLAWGPLNYLARFMLWILVKLHALTGNYGWSIILLTLLVRILFYPVTARGNASMKKMQAIQPKIKELREKYKDNPQLMNAKMMELYRAEGVNPFGGCLPILLQIPVFFALYATLEGAVELRQSSFLWCRDLAAADTIARVNLYFFTLPINPLVLAMTGLMVLQQHMTPMSMDPMQKKMMLLMPFIMLFFFYDLPSGLTLYWTVSNVFSIIQLRLQQRAKKSTVAA